MAMTLCRIMFGVRIIGGCLLAATGSFFTYYTLWVLILPFVADDQVYIHSWFPPNNFALCIPLLAGVIGLALIGSYVATVISDVARTTE